MSRLQQWMNPRDQNSKSPSDVCSQGSVLAKESPTFAFQSPPPKIVKAPPTRVMSKFSVPPPKFPDKFSSPPPVVVQQKPLYSQKVASSSSSPSPSIDRSAELLWQKILSTVNAAVLNGQAHENVLLNLLDIKQQMDTNKTGRIGNGSFIYESKPFAQKGRNSDATFNVIDGKQSHGPFMTDQECFFNGQSQFSGTSGSGNSVSSGRASPDKYLANFLLEQNSKSSVNGGCAYCYAQFKRVCQMLNNRWPPMDSPGHSWSGHSLYDGFGNVMCPELKRQVCDFCSATGSDAHMEKFCPLKAVYAN